MDAVFEHEVTVRYRDLDTYGHVNNVVYGTYVEEARIAWSRSALDVDDDDEFAIVLASLDLEFHRPVTERGSLTVSVVVTDVGRTSYTLSYRIRDGDDVVATGGSTQVYVDPQTREPEPLPEEWRAVLEPLVEA